MARGSRGSGRRTDYEWFNIGDVEVGEDLSVDTAVFGTTNFIFGSAGTLTRLRGKVGVTLDSAAVDESSMILCGLLVMPSDAVVAGAAPELSNNGVDDGSWIWQGALYVTSLAEAQVSPQFLSDSIEIDSKAMRRVKGNQSLVFIFQSPAALTRDAAGTYDITWFVHGLFGR